MRTINIKVAVPDEYDDVVDEIVFDDFIENPKLWEMELLLDKGKRPKKPHKDTHEDII